MNIHGVCVNPLLDHALSWSSRRVFFFEGEGRTEDITVESSKNGRFTNKVRDIPSGKLT
jgi:hypothetical protein